MATIVFLEQPYIAVSATTATACELPFVDRAPALAPPA